MPGGEVIKNFIQIDPSWPAMKLLILIFIIVLISFALNFFLSHSFLGLIYRFFVAPGIIVHELSHAFFCVATGATITKISLFEKDGGRVEHKHSRIPIFGQLLISLAPFVVGFGCLYLISHRLGISLNIDLNNIQLGPTAKTMLNQVVASIKNYDYKSAILFYLALSIAITMVPSVQDFKNILIFIIAGILIVGLLVHYHVISLSALSVPAGIFGFVSTVIFLLILGLIFSIIIFAISKLFRPI